MIVFQQEQNLLLFEEAGDLEQSYKCLQANEESKRWEEFMYLFMEFSPDSYNDDNSLEFEKVPIVFFNEDGKSRHL